MLARDVLIRTIVFLVVSAGFLAGTAQGQLKYPVPEGAAHPDFAFPNIETGELEQLSDYRGKKLLLIHFASW